MPKYPIYWGNIVVGYEVIYVNWMIGEKPSVGSTLLKIRVILILIILAGFFFEVHIHGIGNGLCGEQ